MGIVIITGICILWPSLSSQLQEKEQKLLKNFQTTPLAHHTKYTQTRQAPPQIPGRTRSTLRTHHAPKTWPHQHHRHIIVNHSSTSHFEKLIELFNGLLNERLELKRLGHADENTSTDVLEELLRLLQANEINKIHTLHLFIDLFAAGTDTTSSTVEWGMAEVLRNSETVLVKAKAELNQVIGKGKIVEESDISKLAYLRCIVKETLRLHPPVPFLIPRRVEDEVELCGYTLPKNSQVLVNAWAIGRDPTLWRNPLLFEPERFMDSEVDVYGHDYELIPFGAGRRTCPGLPLAMRMVPVMLGSLINGFEWKLEGEIAPKELDMEDKFGLTLAKLHPLRAAATPVVP